MVLITAAGIALPAAVSAQAGPGRPLSLVPGPSPSPAPADTPDPGDGPASGSTVRTAPLGALDIAGQGTLTPQAGGFDRDLWRGLNRPEILALIDRIPTRAASPAMRRLTERLLLTDADLPPPTRLPGEGSLLAARAEVLADLGLAPALMSLANRGDAFLRDGSAAASLIEAMLLSGRGLDACELGDRIGADAATRSGLPIYCAARNADTDRLNSVLDGVDPVTAAIARSVAAGRPRLPDDAWRALGDPSPLILALMMAGGLAASPSSLAVQDPGRLLALAYNPANEIGIRLEAAERAAASGALSPGRLARLYAEWPSSAAAVTSATGDGASDPVTRARVAATYRAAPDDPQALHALITVRTATVEDAGSPAVLVALTYGLSADRRLGPIAAPAARAAYVHGPGTQAQAWHAAARVHAGVAGDRATLSSLAPFQALAEGPAAVDGPRPPRLDTWQADLGAARTPPDRAAALGVFWPLWEAIGGTVDDRIWRSVPLDFTGGDPSPTVPLGLVRRLDVAARNGEIGHTVGLVLALLGDAGPQASAPELVAAAVAALDRIGLDASARAIAGEAAWTRLP